MSKPYCVLGVPQKSCDDSLALGLPHEGEVRRLEVEHLRKVFGVNKFDHSVILFRGFYSSIILDLRVESPCL